MKRFAKNQLGFGAIEILIVVVVIAVLAGGGFLVYKHSKKGTVNKDTAATTTQTTTQQPITNNTQPVQQTNAYLVIKEWGVRMKLSSNTASMYYYINPQLPDVAYLSLKSVSSIAPNCAADKFALGGISRLTPAEHQANLNDPTRGIPGSIQIGNYWYGYQSSHADCTDGTPSMQASVNGARANANPEDAFKTLEAVPATN